MNCRLPVVLLAAVCGLMVFGCGPGPKEKITDAETRMKALGDKGVPDSLFTDARVLISEAQGFLMSGNGMDAGRSIDSALRIVTNAETWFSGGQESLKPQLDQKRAALAVEFAKLTGPQKVVADSMLAIADGFLGKGMILQARQQLLLCDTACSLLIRDEARMIEAIAKLPGGFWAEVEQSDDKKTTRTKKIMFKADKTFVLSEEEKAVTPEEKHDWAFTSGGTWSVKGDSVIMNVTREKCTKMAREIKIDGKWKKETKPGYDSTITDGHKDVMIEFTYMEKEMQRQK